MRKSLLISFALILFFRIGVAQNIPNAGFDSIYIGGIDRVYQWITSDAVNFSSDTAQPFTPNNYFPPWSGMHHFLINTVLLNYLEPDSNHYIYSLCLYNRADLRNPDGTQFNSFIFNGIEFYSDSSGRIAPSRSGSAFAHRPLKIRGMYRYEDSLAAVHGGPKISALLKRWNPQNSSHDTIALALSDSSLGATQAWMPFEIPFDYRSPALPDSVLILIEASRTGQAPLSLCIDDISFVFQGQYLPDYQSKGLMRVVPNPASVSFSLEPPPPPDTRYLLYDARGVLVAEGLWNGAISRGSLPAGIYLLRFPARANAAIRVVFN